MTFSQWFDESGLSQHEAARFFDTTQTSIKRWIEGTIPRKSTIAMIAAKTQDAVTVLDWYT